MCKTLKMWWSLCCVFITILLQNVCFGQHHIMCANNTQQQRVTRACTTQIQAQNSPNFQFDSCTVEYFPKDSYVCKNMSFGPIASNAHMGRVGLEPYIFNGVRNGIKGNYTVLNVTFSDIKWKTMKFRFQVLKKQDQDPKNHCRNIVLSKELAITDQSVLYYDCYWSVTDGVYAQSHIFDFQATDFDNKVINRGQYHFNIPSAQMLSSTVSIEQWVPFVYLEILTGTMKLHIMPPPRHLNITAYEIKVMKEADKSPEVVRQTIEKLMNNTQEVTWDYSLLYNGSYYFVVTPLHSQCYSEGQGCRSVESPRITITSDGQNLSICIVSITALVVASLFAYYVLMKLIKLHKDYTRTPDTELQISTKGLVVYSPVNPHHAECVDSFVNLLRYDYGLDIMYDLDISNTEHKDPFLWATKSFERATHVIYIVSPPEQANNKKFYDKPLMNPYKNLDILSSVQLQNNAGSENRKKVLYVFFEHSERQSPTQTQLGKSFYLTKDWNKMIQFLSKNIPKQDISRTEKGQSFLNYLKHGTDKC